MNLSPQAGLPDVWRDRARKLDDYARNLRRNDGDSTLAQDAEAAAVDYRIAADELEHELNCLACAEGVGLHAIDCPRRNDELAAKRQERIDSLAGGGPGPSPAWDQAGMVNVRLVCGVAGVAALALFVWLLWPYLVGAAVIAAGYRVATRGMRRPRPRSSWSSLGRTAAAMYAAWNSRWLKGPMLRASVPAKAGRGQGPCGECGHDEPVPF